MRFSLIPLTALAFAACAPDSANVEILRMRVAFG